MPYIKPKRRPKIDRAVDGVVKALASLPDGGNPGDLNYAITTLVLKVLIDQGEPSYQALAQGGVMTLECAKLEFYRKAMAVYERCKEDENGAVFPSIAWNDGWESKGRKDQIVWGKMPQVKEAGRGKKKKRKEG